MSCPPLPPLQCETSYIEVLALTTAVAAAKTIGLAGHLNVRHDEEGGESERIRGVRGGVAVCVDGFVARHEMECSSVGS